MEQEYGQVTDNGQMTEASSPVPAMFGPSIQDDTRPPQEPPEAVVYELSAATRPFAATGKARVKIGRQSMLLDIQSVPSDVHTREHKRLQPRNLPRVTTETGRYVVDETSDMYTEWQLQGMYLRVLLGLPTLTLKDRTGRVVWSLPQDIRDARAGIQALKDAGLTDQQLIDLLQQINGLTRDDARREHQEQEDFLSA